jgi:hypothetical protein
VTIAEISIGAQVFDRALQRGGMVVAIHKHMIWSRIADLEQS